jgi:hypothetical protein
MYEETFLRRAIEISAQALATPGTEPFGAVIVKVHLANRTVTPRPYPAIQLTLTDREGETIGKRTYTAEDYSTPADASELPANGVAVVSLHLTSPDESAVGFEASIVDTGM